MVELAHKFDEKSIASISKGELTTKVLFKFCHRHIYIYIYINHAG